MSESGKLEDLIPFYDAVIAAIEARGVRRAAQGHAGQEVGGSEIMALRHGHIRLSAKRFERCWYTTEQAEAHAEAARMFVMAELVTKTGPGDR